MHQPLPQRAQRSPPPSPPVAPQASTLVEVEVEICLGCWVLSTGAISTEEEERGVGGVPRETRSQMMVVTTCLGVGLMVRARRKRGGLRLPRRCVCAYNI